MSKKKKKERFIGLRIEQSDFDGLEKYVNEKRNLSDVIRYAIKKFLLTNK